MKYLEAPVINLELGPDEQQEELANHKIAMTGGVWVACIVGVSALPGAHDWGRSSIALSSRVGPRRPLPRGRSLCEVFGGLVSWLTLTRRFKSSKRFGKVARKKSRNSILDERWNTLS